MYTHVSGETNLKTEGTRSRQETSTKHHQGSTERRPGDFLTSGENGGRVSGGRNGRQALGTGGISEVGGAQGGQHRQNETDE